MRSRLAIASPVALITAAGSRCAPPTGSAMTRSMTPNFCRSSAVMATMANDGPVGVPVIEAKGSPLAFHRWRPGCAMEPGLFGAAVPANGVEIIPQVVIVPLVAFDRKGGRLGYGGGFYDRTLEYLRMRGRVFAVGFAYAAQEAKELPLEPTDQPLDAIVTEQETLRF